MENDPHLHHRIPAIGTPTILHISPRSLASFQHHPRGLHSSKGSDKLRKKRRRTRIDHHGGHSKMTTMIVNRLLKDTKSIFPPPHHHPHHTFPQSSSNPHNLSQMQVRNSHPAKWRYSAFPPYPTKGPLESRLAVSWDPEYYFSRIGIVCWLPSISSKKSTG